MLLAANMQAQKTQRKRNRRLVRVGRSHVGNVGKGEGEGVKGGEARKV